MKRYVIVFTILILVGCVYADFPVIKTGDLTPGDSRFGHAIGKSKTDELTIASFNIRNLGNMNRGLKDFEALADLMDEADVVLLQEVGLGMFRGEGTEVSEEESKRLNAITALFRIYLGDQWTLLLPPHPSGIKSGRETSILAHRLHASGYHINSEWNNYVKLSEGKRDMAIYKLILTKEDQTKEILLGTVHLTPDDPERGIQMIKVSEWMLEQEDAQAIVMGDFNWGYKKASGLPEEENYKGETKIQQLQQDGKIYQLFASLSYNGAGGEDKFRTNMGFRNDAFFYDQFLLTPGLAEKLADGGTLLEDCGFIAFGLQNNYMKKAIERLEKRRKYGLEKYLSYLKKKGIPQEELDEVQKKAIEDASKRVSSQAQNDATWVLSDHRIVWMQLKMW